MSTKGPKVGMDTWSHPFKKVNFVVDLSTKIQNSFSHILLCEYSFTSYMHCIPISGQAVTLF